jgi:hypothetical protein
MRSRHWEAKMKSRLLIAHRSPVYARARVTNGIVLWLFFFLR